MKTPPRPKIIVTLVEAKKLMASGTPVYANGNGCTGARVLEIKDGKARCLSTLDCKVPFVPKVVYYYQAERKVKTG